MDSPKNFLIYSFEYYNLQGYLYYLYYNILNQIDFLFFLFCELFEQVINTCFQMLRR